MRKYLLQVVGVSKRGFRTKGSAFLFLFYVGEKRKMKQTERNISKIPENSVLGCFELFAKMAFFRKLGKHWLCSEGKNAHFRWHSLFFWKWYFSLWPYNHQTLQARGKIQMARLVAKVPFWKGPPKGFLLSVIHKSCALLKTLCLLSAKHSFAEMKEGKQTEVYQKLGVVCQHAKRCSFVVFLCFGFLLFVVVHFLIKNSQKGCFPGTLEVFPLLFTQKVCLKTSFCSVVFLFSICLTFHNSIVFLCFLSINFLKNAFGFFGRFGLSIFVAFSFVNVCLFLCNKLS